jgi:glucose-1-phosphatase
VVVFDLGGVIARFLPGRRLARLAELSGHDAELIQEEIFASGFDRRAECGALSSEETISQVLEILGNGVSRVAVIEAWAQAFDVHREVLMTVRDLSAKTVIFTNNGPMLDLCLHGPLAEIARAFDEVVCSWHLRARKPAPEAFERAARRLSTRPDSILLLDDTVANVSAACEQGWQAHVITEPRCVRTVLSRYSLL